MATALAAGLAALLLYITQLVKPEAYEQLRKPKEMKDRLMKVGGAEKYIPAKDLFRLEFKDDPNWRWNSRTNLGKEKMGYLVSKFTVSNAGSPTKSVSRVPITLDLDSWANSTLRSERGIRPQAYHENSKGAGIIRFYVCIRRSLPHSICYRLTSICYADKNVLENLGSSC